MTEDAIHRSILQYLRAVLPHGWIVMHVPNGGSRNKIEGAKMKGLGVMAGWPDLSIFGPDGRVYFLEVKSAKGRLHPSQSALHDRLMDLGYGVAVVRSIDHVRAFIAVHEIPTKDRGWEHISAPVGRVLDNLATKFRDAAE